MNQVFKCLTLAIISLSLCAGARAAEKEVAVLDATEQAYMAFALAQKPPGEITILCGNEFCKAAADSVAGIFRDAQWKVDQINHKLGPGVDGLKGLRLVSCDISAQTIQDVLKQLTKRKVEVIANTQCSFAYTRGHLWLTIGEP